jgi:acetoin utilization deacetylase AcuC-like enzyme
MVDWNFHPMQVGFVIDDLFLGHEPPSDHPERPERLRAIGTALAEHGLASRGTRLPTRAATDEELGRVHEAATLAELERHLPGRRGWLDEDTYFSPGSWKAALAAAGAAVDLTLASVDDRLPRGIAIVRPPGHHATPSRPMGFCLLNNVAIAAAAARARGCARVAIVDWDVHHGNGTQDAFYADPTVLYASTHQYPFYPGSGASTEIGLGAGVGTTVNVPLPEGSGDAEYAAAFDEVIGPTLRAFRPDLILVSAGYDTFVDDPLAGMRVTAAGFVRMARSVRAVADEVCSGRMVCVLEGGYDLDGLAAGALATFDALGQERVEPVRAPSREPILRGARQNIEATQRALASYFPGAWSETAPGAWPQER